MSEDKLTTLKLLNQYRSKEIAGHFLIYEKQDYEADPPTRISWMSDEFWQCERDRQFVTFLVHNADWIIEQLENIPQTPLPAITQ